MKKVELHRTGLDYLRSTLQGGDYLAKALLRTCSLDLGSVYTLLPTDVDPGPVSLEQGGLGEPSFYDVEAPVAQFLANSWRLPPVHGAVIEADRIEPDKSLSHWAAYTARGCKYLTTRRTTRKHNPDKVDLIGVYGVVMADQANPTYLKNFLEETSPFRQIGA